MDEAFPPADLQLLPREALAGEMLRYEPPLEIGGVQRVCTECGVDRDWLVLNSGDNVWLRCRSGHEWYEPALDAHWFDQYSDSTTAVYGTRGDALTTLGFDGTFAGTIL